MLELKQFPAIHTSYMLYYCTTLQFNHKYLNRKFETQKIMNSTVHFDMVISSRIEHTLFVPDHLGLWHILGNPCISVILGSRSIAMIGADKDSFRLLCDSSSFACDDCTTKTAYRDGIY